MNENDWTIMWLLRIREATKLTEPHGQDEYRALDNAISRLEAAKKPCPKCEEWEKAYDQLIEETWRSWGSKPWVAYLPETKPYSPPTSGETAMAIQKWAKTLDPRRREPEPPANPFDWEMGV